MSPQEEITDLREKLVEAYDVVKTLCMAKQRKDSIGKDEFYQKIKSEGWTKAFKLMKDRNLR